MSERFYVSSPISEHVVLQGPEARHAVLVCRLQQGDHVYLFHGDGHEYRAEITALGKDRVDLTVLERFSPQRELPFRLEVACPLPKGDRGQFLIEKLAELGVSRFVPLRTRRSVVHPSESRQEKLARYVIEASKQCGRNVLMQIGPLRTVETHLIEKDLPPLRLLAHPSGEPLTPPHSGQDVAVAIGPEGGFSDEEVEGARGAGWRIVSLGPRVLRVETAALAIAAILAVPSHENRGPSHGGDA
jgi:16S rRNA (uracil1498-N3)-methyltransferase